VSSKDQVCLFLRQLLPADGHAFRREGNFPMSSVAAQDIAPSTLGSRSTWRGLDCRKLLPVTRPGTPIIADVGVQRHIEDDREAGYFDAVDGPPKGAAIPNVHTYNERTRWIAGSSPRLAIIWSGMT
jgi:hypothetical protein